MNKQKVDLPTRFLHSHFDQIIIARNIPLVTIVCHKRRQESWLPKRDELREKFS